MYCPSDHRSDAADEVQRVDWNVNVNVNDDAMIDKQYSYSIVNDEEARGMILRRFTVSNDFCTGI